MNLPMRPARLPDASLRDMLAFGAVVVTPMVPIALSLGTVGPARPMVDPASNPTPLGFTWSLSLFLVPIVVLLAAAVQRSVSSAARRAGALTLAILIPVGVLTEFVLSSSCFTFRNAGAVLGPRLPVLGATAPIEEYAFYCLGFPAILLAYLWADHRWCDAYHVHDRDIVEGSPAAMIRVTPATAAAGAALLGGAVAAKRAIDGGGFPTYFAWIFLVAVLPVLLLLPTARRCVNWRALSFSVLLLLLVSVVWEANLAIPYQWWGYQRGPMIGVFVGAWSGLPVEEPFLWTLASCTTAVLYEALRVGAVRAERRISSGVSPRAVHADGP